VELVYPHRRLSFVLSSETSCGEDSRSGQAAVGRSNVRHRVNGSRFTSSRQHSLVHARSAASWRRCIYGNFISHQNAECTFPPNVKRGRIL